MTDVEESVKVRLDQETAHRLQNEHPEQFVTLVRMHLSFELDLNTDTENDPTGLDKHKAKKWKGFHKKAKGCTSTKMVSPEAAKTTLTKANIDDLKQLIAFLELEENITQEGIFRKTGSLTRQNELKNLLVQGDALSLDQGGYTAHDCASVLKSFLADLSEPLLTELYYPAYCQVAEFFHSKDSQVARGEDRLLNALQLLLLLLPEENNTLLRCIIELLNRTIRHEATNKMSAENLATLFTPHLLCPRKLGPEALHSTAQQMSGIVGFMIKTGLRLFHIPPKLATDIRAYFVDQKRRKTMSPEHILNESTTSDSVANTVYTFVDREKTAEAHIMNSTDTALAQLYAHIQSLPESSKKKKLVSKFNRQNGYGTPLQVLMLRDKNGPLGGSSGSAGGGLGSAGGIKYPRSISDSIKRHIFHKSLMSRTPKRSVGSSRVSGSGQTPITFQTPNGANYNAPKQRVLFQSPISSPLISSPATTGSSSGSSNSSGINSPACLKRCSSVSSSSSSSLSSGAGTGAGMPIRTNSSGSSSSSSSTTSEKVGQGASLKRLSSGEPDELVAGSDGDTVSLESGSERKRSRLEESHSMRPMVRFGSDSGELLDDGEPPPPEDDEDFVEQEDDDIGEAEAEDESRRQLRLLAQAEEEEDDEDVFSSDELLLVGGASGEILSDGEEDRYVGSPGGCAPGLGDARSRYRSEPNLSAIVYRQHRGRTDYDLLVEETTIDGPLGEGVTLSSKKIPTTATPGTGSSKPNRMNINFFKSKLIKGVSMGNLRFPFGNDSKASKKNSNRSSSGTLNSPLVKRAPSAAKTTFPFDECLTPSSVRHSSSSLLPGIVSSELGLPTDDLSQRGWNYAKRDSNEHPPLAAAAMVGLVSNWSANYLTSTPGPAALGGRNSMSPITKSTQRMPKSMQESIMTPRSRKPVILLAGMNGNDQQQLSTTCASFSSLKEEDEEADMAEQMVRSPESISTSGSSGSSLSVSQNEAHQHKMLINGTGLPPIGDEVGLPPAPEPPLHSGGTGSFPMDSGVGREGSPRRRRTESSTLTNNFRDYLLSRSVMPESPTDLSFASQSDDFDSSSSDTLEQLSESKMSKSLLFCMNGNEPPKGDLSEEMATKPEGDSRVSAPVAPASGVELDETAL